ncbi:hypothetical protein FA13DRAFT_1623955 [Coprinellus micaceus]|uniref:HMA domain-containing protein n=1 Tax=Coprinellus micaceus TaxID=71717 RepID=A0A4Y7TQV4_COPMI|nr:hypothetical protein FA13DRAFT_1623955 [Coprinellus micaceus]
MVGPSFSDLSPRGIDDLVQSEHTYKFDVKMTCGGCSGAVTRVLTKAKDNGGVSSFDVSLEKQEVIVKGTLPYDEVLEKIKKTGKEVCPGLLKVRIWRY